MTEIGAVLWKWIEAAALWFFDIFCRILHKNHNKEADEAFLQFVKFGLVGVSNTVVHYGIYVTSLLCMQSAGLFMKLDYIIATAIAFFISVLWSFFWNNKFVFTIEEGEHRPLFRALVKTYISYSFTGLFLNSVLMLLWVRVFHISEYFAPILNLLISVPINFLINKFWAFKKER